jgi:nucleoid-associated protein YgaU
MILQYGRTLFLFISIIVFTFNGCSSSSTKDDATAESDDAAFASDEPSAETDAVPSDSIETPQKPPTEEAVAPETPPTDVAAAGSPPSESVPPEKQPVTPAEGASEVPPVPPAAPASAGQSTESSRAVGDTPYTLKQGETLMQIAFYQYGDLTLWRDIYESNKDVIHDPNNVPVGVSLKLKSNLMKPAPELEGQKVLIQPGDTLVKISQKVYGTPSRWKEIWQHNRGMVKNPNKIYAGFYIYYLPSESGNSSADAAVMPGSSPAPVPSSDMSALSPPIIPAPIGADLTTVAPQGEEASAPPVSTQ